MKLAITGHRKISDEDIDLVRKTIRDLASHSNNDTFILGGALGVDLEALDELLLLKQDGVNVNITVVLPSTLSSTPNHSRKLIEKSIDLISLEEMGLDPSNKGSYLKRNNRMLELADGLIVFWNGDPFTGTGYTLRKAYDLDKKVAVFTLGATQ